MGPACVSSLRLKAKSPNTPCDSVECMTQAGGRRFIMAILHPLASAHPDQLVAVESKGLNPSRLPFRDNQTDF